MTLFNARPITERARLFFYPKQLPLDEALRFGARPGDRAVFQQRGHFIKGALFLGR